MIEIDKVKIGEDYPPYIIAELSANHNGSLEKAKETILCAKQKGAKAVKIQTYTADSMTINCQEEDFLIKGGLWDGYFLYDLYNEASTPYAWHEELFNYAKEIGITLFSTPFDEKAVDLLEDLNTPAYKIASFELTDLPLIEYIAKKNKPILISTGMGSEKEIKEAIETIKKEGCENLLIFHCISSYPTPTELSNLNMIKYLKNKFNTEVGLSDHTLDNISSIIATSMGASAIEKHFILSRENKGPDSDFSIEPEELKLLVGDVEKAWKSIGTKNFSRPAIEDKNLVFRRSLYFVKAMQKGEIITDQNIRRIRPGYGINPKFFKEVIGKRVLKDIKKGERVSWDKICD